MHLGLNNLNNDCYKACNISMYSKLNNSKLNISKLNKTNSSIIGKVKLSFAEAQASNLVNT